MTFSCERCQNSHTIDPEKIGPEGVKVACSECGHINFFQQGEPSDAAASDVEAPDASLEDELGAAFDSMFEGGLGEEPAAEPATAQDAEEAPAALDVASAEWYVAIEGQQVGPVSYAELEDRWAGGIIGPDSLCWTAGFDDWTPISEVPALHQKLPPKVGAAVAPIAQEAAPISQEMDGAPEIETGEPAALAESAAAGEESAAPEPEDEWRPTAASALSSLVDQELKEAEARDEEAAQNPGIPDPETTGIRVLLKDLPEAPEAEPSKFIPLRDAPEAPTPAPAPAPKKVQVATAKREREGGSKWGLAAVAALVLVIGGGAFAYFGGFLDGKVEEAPLAAAQVEPPPTAAQPKKEPPAEVAAVAGEGGAGGEEGEETAVADEADEADMEEEGADSEAVAAAEKAPEAPSAPKPTKAAAQKAPTPARPAPTPAPKAPSPARTTQASAPKKAPTPAKAPPTRRAAPAPTPAKRSGSRDLLAAGRGSSIDALFEEELSAPAPARRESGSNTYIPPPPGSGSQKPRSLSQGDIMGVVAGQRADLRDCATKYKDQGGTSGSVVMSWGIEPNGKTSGIKAVKGAEHAQMVTCLTGLIRGWTFPEYAGPKMAPIEFPFQF